MYYICVMKTKILSFVVRNTWLPGTDHGWGNGYVIIFKDHPMYGKHYNDFNQNIYVHGGLTFSSHISEMENFTGYSDEEIKDGWVIGFDTAHLHDNIYNWPKREVLKETERLRKQIIELSLDTGKTIEKFEFK